MGLRVRITSLNDGQSITLVDSPESIIKLNFTFNGVRVLQFDDLAFAEYKSIRDSGNRVNEVSFEAARSTDDAATRFADAEAAVVWAMDHAAQLPVLCSAQFRFTGPRTNAARYFDPAALQSVRLVRDIGGVQILQYTLVGGEWLKKAPLT